MDENWSLDAAHVELRFVSEPAYARHARVLIDGVWAGNLRRRSVRTFAVRPGAHTVEVSYKDKEPRACDIAPGPRDRVSLECGLGAGERPMPRIPWWTIWAGSLAPILIADVLDLDGHFPRTFVVVAWLLCALMFVMDRRERRSPLFLRPPIDPEILKAERRAMFRRPRLSLRQAMILVAALAILSAAFAADRKARFDRWRKAYLAQAKSCAEMEEQARLINNARVAEFYAHLKQEYLRAAERPREPLDQFRSRENQRLMADAAQSANAPPTVGAGD